MTAEVFDGVLPSLAFDEKIRVWWAPFSALEAQFDDARACLSRAEQTRFRAFAFAADARRFALGRWFLRAALSAWPSETLMLRQSSLIGNVVFTERTGQAPQAAIAGQATPLAFSLSRSMRYMAVAAGMVSALGIDLEDNDRASVINTDLICQFFHLSEQVLIAESEDSIREDRVLASWTGKEAIVKAAGLGMRAPFQAIHLQGENIVALPPVLGQKERCRLRLQKLNHAALAVAWW